jgi:predicted GNAT superfamily acetyltransferase
LCAATTPTPNARGSIENVSRTDLETLDTVQDRAAAAARKAAEHAGVEIRVLDTLPEFEAASRLVSRIWDDDEPKAPASLLRALAHADNFVAGAWADHALVGISLGFFGIDGGELYLHSHITGVDPLLQGRSVGFALKQFQRTWALEHGTPTVRWTADPLVRMNMFFDLVKLGATIVSYHDDFYGRIEDGLNSGEETDRVEFRWDLSSDRAAAAAEHIAGTAAPPATEGAVILRPDPAGAPAIPDADGDTLLAWIPEDIVRLRESDAAMAHAWRRALRDTVGRSLSDGFRAEAITRDGWFVLTR